MTLGLVATNPPFGSLGVGFGRADMHGTDIVIGIVNNSQVTIEDYYAFKEGKPSLDSNISGCKSSYYLFDSLVNTSHMIFTFGRSIDPEDACDYPLTQNDSMLMAFAWKNVSNLSFHGQNHGQVKVNFTQGFQGYASPLNGSKGTGITNFSLHQS